MSRRCSIDGCQAWSFLEGKCRNHHRESSKPQPPSLGQVGRSLQGRSISDDERNKTEESNDGACDARDAAGSSIADAPPQSDPSGLEVGAQLVNARVPVPKICVMGNLVPGQFASYKFQVPKNENGRACRPRSLKRRLECQLCGAFGASVKPPVAYCQECGYGLTRA